VSHDKKSKIRRLRIKGLNKNVTNQKLNIKKNQKSVKSSIITCHYKLMIRVHLISSKSQNNLLRKEKTYSVSTVVILFPSSILLIKDHPKTTLDNESQSTTQVDLASPVNTRSRERWPRHIFQVSVTVTFKISTT
jgi:hypothetical protein